MSKLPNLNDSFTVEEIEGGFPIPKPIFEMYVNELKEKTDKEILSWLKEKGQDEYEQEET